MKKLLIWMLILAMSFSMLVGCGQQPAENSSNHGNNTEQTPNAEKTPTNEVEKADYLVESLKLKGDGDRGGPNPFLQTAGGGGDRLVRLCFDSLIDEGDKEENDLRPLLAEEWSLEGNTYHFKLVEDALWHDGEKVTADDVAFTISYYQKHAPTPNLLCSGDYNSIVEVTVIDDYNIDVTFDKVYSTTTNFIGFMYILPQHIWENVEDPYTFTDPEAYIGCGMYDVSVYDKANGAYEFKAFEPYYNGKQVAEYVRFLPVSDELLAFEQGELDIASLPADSKDRYLSDSNIGVIEKVDDNIWELLINFENLPVFSDLDTRIALYKAIDRQAIVDNVLRGNGTVGSAGKVAPTSPYYTDEVEKYEYDVEAARPYLEGKNIKFTIASTKGQGIKICEMIQKNLAEVGVTVEIETVQSGITLRCVKGEYDMILLNHGSMNRTPDYLRTTYSSNYKNTNTGHAFCGPIGWDNAEITELGEKVYNEMDTEKQLELYKELQVAISKEVPVLSICTQTSPYMYRKDYFDGWRASYNFEQFDKVRVNYMQKDTMR